MRKSYDHIGRSQGENKKKSKNLTIPYSYNRYRETFRIELRKDTGWQGSSHHREKKTAASCQRWISSLSLERLTSFFLCRGVTIPLHSRRSTCRCCDRVLIFTLPSFYHFLSYHSLIPPGMKDLACEFWRSIGYLVSLPRDKKGLSIFHPLRIFDRLEPSFACPPLVLLVRQTWLLLASCFKFSTPPKLYDAFAVIGISGQHDSILFQTQFCDSILSVFYFLNIVLNMLYNI